MRRNKRPLFQDFYFGKYEKHEFLIDVDVEFTKIKNLLQKEPRALRDDPILSLDYQRIIDLIKQKKLLEDTTNIYEAESSFYVDWNDPDQVHTQSRLLKKK